MIVEFKGTYSNPVVLFVVKVVVVKVDKVVVPVKLSFPACSRKGWSDKSEWLFGFGSPWWLFFDFWGISAKNGLSGYGLLQPGIRRTPGCNRLFFTLDFWQGFWVNKSENNYDNNGNDTSYDKNHYYSPQRLNIHYYIKFEIYIYFPSGPNVQNPILSNVSMARSVIPILDSI